MESKLSQGSRALRILAGLFFVASPLLMMLILSLMSGENMLLSKPYLNDEISYWRVMYSVKECGFDFAPTGGLPGKNAPIGPLESHGLGPLLCWGWYALLFPFTESALVIADVILLTAAIGLFCLIVRPSALQALAMGAFTLLFPPIVRYINISMMEIPCYGAVIVYMAVFYRYEKSRSFGWLLAVLAAGGYCALLRLSNVVLLFPAILVFCGQRWSWRLPVCLAVYALGVLVLNSFVNLFIAPYPDFVSQLSYCSSYKEVAVTVLRNMLGNIGKMLDPSSDNSIPQAMARYSYLLLTLFLLVMSFFKVEDRRVRLTWNWGWIGMLGAGAGCLALVLLLYDVFDWRDYRTLSPIAYGLILWAMLRWSREGRGYKLALTCLVAFSLLMAPDSYRHVAQDDRFFDTGRSQEDISPMFPDQLCTLGLYGDTYPLSLAMDVPAYVGISTGLYGDVPDNFGMDLVLVRPNDPIPSPDYYTYVGELSHYGDLYARNDL